MKKVLLLTDAVVMGTGTWVWVLVFMLFFWQYF